MSQSEIWRGLEREVRADRSSVAFERARERQPALRPYATLLDAVQSAARQRGTDEREALLAAILDEYRASGGASVWSAAALLAMAPALASLMRSLGARGGRNDAKSIVLTAFLEAVKQIATERRVAFRLYCETRRRVLHTPRPSVEEHWRPSRQDVCRISEGDALSMEALVDRVRFVRRADALAPTKGEKPAEYVERLQPSRTRRECLGRRQSLSNKRAATLADLRAALRSLVI
jgi:hypothetical protein